MKEHAAPRKNNANLSPVAAEDVAGRDRASSIRSHQSGITFVDSSSQNDNEKDSQENHVSRARTLDVSIQKVSRLDFLWGLIFPGKMTRKIAGRATVTGADTSEYELNRNCPWIVAVRAYSTEMEKDGRHYIPKDARCTIDTGNQQGNFVSKRFLIDELKYSESDFLKLNSEEKIGGLSSSNHIVEPEGAVLITWYHTKGTRIFRNMRFLVYEDAQNDLVIGTRSIVKHNLLSRPNLGNRELPIDKPNKVRDNLKGKVEELENALVNRERELVKLNEAVNINASEVSKKKKQIEKIKDQLEAARKDLEDYDKIHSQDTVTPPHASSSQINGHQANKSQGKADQTNGDKTNTSKENTRSDGSVLNNIKKRFTGTKNQEQKGGKKD